MNVPLEPMGHEARIASKTDKTDLSKSQGNTVRLKKDMQMCMNGEPLVSKAKPLKELAVVSHMSAEE